MLSGVNRDQFAMIGVRVGRGSGGLVDMGRRTAQLDGTLDDGHTSSSSNGQHTGPTTPERCCGKMTDVSPALGAIGRRGGGTLSDIVQVHVTNQLQPECNPRQGSQLSTIVRDGQSLSTEPQVTAAVGSWWSVADKLAVPLITRRS